MLEKWCILTTQNCEGWEGGNQFWEKFTHEPKSSNSIIPSEVMVKKAGEFHLWVYWTWPFQALTNLRVFPLYRYARPFDFRGGHVFWTNYNDLRRGHLCWWFCKGILLPYVHYTHNGWIRMAVRESSKIPLYSSGLGILRKFAQMFFWRFQAEKNRGSLEYWCLLGTRTCPCLFYGVTGSTGHQGVGGYGEWLEGLLGSPTSRLIPPHLEDGLP